MAHPILSGILLGLAVALIMLCSIGLMVMRDPFQRLQFSSPVTTLAMFFIVVVVWVEDSEWQSRIKATLIGLIIFLMNSALSHATARAIRIRALDRWPVALDENIPLVKDHGKAGEAIP